MIKDQIGYNLKILFVGVNPHPGSYKRGVPFSNNKMFWYLLHNAGLLEELRDVLKDDIQLKHFYEHILKRKYKFGLVNVVNRPSKTATEIKKTESLPGRKRIIDDIHKYKPLIVCFVSKIAYGLFIGSSSSHITYGWQNNIAASKIYVMHAPHRGLASVRIKELKEINNTALSLLKRIEMKKDFKVGDHVSWNSEAGRVRGVIKKKITSPIEFKGYTVHASHDEPQYLIKSDITDHMAMHKSSALRKLTNNN